MSDEYGDSARPLDPDDAVAALASVTGALERSERREGQAEMARRVAEAISSGEHLIAQAGTGTGKTLAYLVPALLSGRTTVVVTATKALQDQVAGKDLPFVVEQLADDPMAGGVDWAVLKGRSNYVCLQRLREMANPDQGQLELDGMAPVAAAEIKRIAEWAGGSESGDVAELDWSPSDAAWRSVSVGSDECPGAERCPLGEPCFAERARRHAQVAEVVVVNTHLYGLDVGADGAILPDHEVVVFDEAHVLEDVMSDTVGVAISPWRFVDTSATVRRIIDDPQLVGSIAELGDAFRNTLGDLTGTRLDRDVPEDLSDLLIEARLLLGSTLDVLGRIEPADDDSQQRRLRAQTRVTRLIEAVDAVMRTIGVSAASGGTVEDGSSRDGDGGGVTDAVAFVSGSPSSPQLEVAPLDVGPTLVERVWNRRTAILTSATIPASLPQRLGLDAVESRVGPSGIEVLDVGSPFDYENHSLLYCAIHLPNPNSAAFREQADEELAAMIEAAGGRTLALFTSYRAMDEAAENVRDRIGPRFPVLTQRDLPKPALVKAFADDEATCLFATAGLFQGVDVPGRTLSLVVIDRIPFPRPDDPLLSARRDALGREAFGQIDLPRASTMLAQAAGRLIRSATDRGVVAVLDPRLGKAGYRWDIVNALPPMKRTRHRSDVEDFLRAVTS
ncbi:MAG: ATP-dependent DNA helicase [Actinomycetota bacterium]